MDDYRSAGSLGERIQAARKARGIRSTKALAELISNGSVSEATLQNIETGRLTNVSLAQVLNIAHALRVAPSILLAPMARPDDLIDLPNLDSGLVAMSGAEFDAWLTGTDDGDYRPTNAAELNERTELAALRDLRRLLRERARLQALRTLETGQTSAQPTREWDRPGDRLETTNDKIRDVTAYLISAGWPIDANGAD